jgi:hypothetical protein
MFFSNLLSKCILQVASWWLHHFSASAIPYVYPSHANLVVLCICPLSSHQYSSMYPRHYRMHMFFSMCMTSKLCRSFNVDQYVNLKKILFFAQFNSTSVRFPRFLFVPLPFPNYKPVTWSSCCNSSSMDNSLGSNLYSLVPSNNYTFRRHIWPLGSHLWWPM